MKTKSRFTPEQKAAYKEEKRAEQQSLLESAYLSIGDSDAWENWLKYARPNLKRYSFLNSLLIESQKPGTCLVHGRKQWLKDEVHVSEDAKTIRILAPMFVNRLDKSGAVMYGGYRTISSWIIVQAYWRMENR